IRQLTYDFTVIRRGAAGARPALEGETGSGPRSDRDIKTIPVPDLFSEIVGVGDVVIRRDIKLIGFHVVKTAHGVSTPARQLRIEGSLDAEGIEVSGRQCTVLNNNEVAEPGAEVRSIHRHQRHELPLNAGGKLPVEITLAPAVQRVRIVVD